jgi:hypothetical protein
VVDAGLTGLGAGEPGRDDPEEGPSAQLLILVHEGPAGVTLAGVLAAVFVARAEHVVKDLDLFVEKTVFVILKVGQNGHLGI